VEARTLAAEGAALRRTGHLTKPHCQPVEALWAPREERAQPRHLREAISVCRHISQNTRKNSQASPRGRGSCPCDKVDVGYSPAMLGKWGNGTRWVQFGLMVAVASHARESQACGPCSCETPNGIWSYLQGGSKVPQNARFLVSLNEGRSGSPSFGSEDVALKTVAEFGPSVAITVEPAGTAAEDAWIVPATPLDPKTDYELTIGPKTGLGSRFATSAEVDTTPPEVGPPRIEKVGSSSSCNDFRGVKLVWDEIKDNGKPVEYNPVVQLDVQSAVSSARLMLSADFFSQKGELTLAARKTNEDDCWGAFSLPSEGFEGPLSVTATVFDLAGNGTRLDPVEVTLEEQLAAGCARGQGCQATPSEARPNWLAVLGAFGSLLLLALAGRARATTTSSSS
jgi:hypothetical protein